MSNAGSGCLKVIAIIGVTIFTIGRRSISLFDDLGRTVVRSTDDFSKIAPNGSRAIDDFGRLWSEPSSLIDDLGRVPGGTGSSVDDVLYSTRQKDNLFATDDVLKNIGGRSTSQFDNLYGPSLRQSGFDELECELIYKSALKSGRGVTNVVKEQVTQVTEDCARLRRAFPDNPEIVKSYHSGYINSASLAEARVSILPKELVTVAPNSPKAQLFSLYKGIKLNRDQAKLISELTGLKIPPTPNRIFDYSLLEEKGGFISVRTAKGSFKFSTDKANLQIRKNATIIVDGELSNPVKAQLAKAGVKFVQTHESLVRNLASNPSKTKFIFVGSKDRIRVSELFQVGDEDASKLLKTFGKVDQIDNSVIVESRGELTNQIARETAAGNDYVVIYNNIDNKLFGQTPSNLKVDKYITCNSHSIPSSNVGTTSLDFIYFDDLVSALQKTSSRQLADMDAYWHSMISEYTTSRAINERTEKVLLAVFGGTGASGSIFAIHKLSEDD